MWLLVSIQEAFAKGLWVVGALVLLGFIGLGVYCLQRFSKALTRFKSDQGDDVAAPFDRLSLSTDQAGPAFRQQLEEHPRVRALYGEALKALDARLAGRAIQRLGQAIEVRPQAAFLYHARALVKYEVGDLSGAEADCHKAIQYDSTECGFYALRASVHAAQGRVTEARQDLAEAIERAPDRADLYVRRAELSIDSDNAAALEDLNRALELSPQHPRGLMMRARARLQEKSFAAALEDLDAYARLETPDETVYDLRVSCFLGLDNLAKALEACRKGMQQQPDSVRLQARLQEVQAAIQAAAQKHAG